MSQAATIIVGILGAAIVAMITAFVTAYLRRPTDRASATASLAAAKLAEAQTESTQIATLITIQTNLVARVDGLVSTNEKLVTNLAEANANLVLAIAALAASKLIQEDLQVRVKDFDSKVSRLTATNQQQVIEIAALTSQVTTLQERIVALDKQVAELTQKSGEDAAKIQDLLLKLNRPADVTAPTVEQAGDAAAAAAAAAAGGGDTKVDHLLNGIQELAANNKPSEPKA